MLRLVVVLTLALLPLVATAQPPIPATPAGSAAKAWLTALNAADGPSLKVFNAK